MNDKPISPLQNGEPETPKYAVQVFEDAFKEALSPSVRPPPSGPPSPPPGVEEEKPLFLFIEQGPAAGQAFQIVPGSCIIGRASIVDLCLRHPSVSRRHAQLRRLGNQLYLRDLGSQNGTYVNQQRICAEAEVFAGDTIIIGSSLLKLKDTLLENTPAEKPQNKPPKGRRAPYYTLLVASLSASLATLVAMFLLKLLFQPAASSPPEVEISPTAPLASTPAPPPPAPPQQLETAPPPNRAAVLEAFRQGRAEEALQMAKTAKQNTLAQQLSAFLAKWKTAEGHWNGISKTKPTNPRSALASHEEALRAAARISANSSYVQELQTRISSLKQMTAKKPAAPPRPSSPSAKPPPASAPPAPRQPPPASRELQEKRRAISDAFGDF